MGKRKLGALEKVEADLPNLQHKIRKDPQSYAGNFRTQYQQYESHRDIFLAAPSSADANGVLSLRDLVDFVSHIADCYPDITKNFTSDLIQILNTHHQNLDPELREKIVSCLVLLRKKAVINSTTLLQTFFPILVSTPSKSLRILLFTKILSDLRSSNSKTKNHKLNRTIQSVLFEILTSDRVSSRGLWAIKLTRELWKRQIWRDAKTVEIMKEASLAENEKVAIGGVRFFLGGDKEREELEEESSDEDDGIDMGKLRHQAGINKKSKKKSRMLEKATSTVKKKERKKNAPHPLNFSALHLLHDPQGLAETLFQKHLQNARSKLNLEQKLLVLQLVSRLVGLHKLTLLPFFSYFLKYLTPRQPSVTSFLASLAQSSHDHVPPETLEPLVQKIANEFVSEAAASEVASAGLNAIREICVRQPLAMNETLLQDLVMYKKSKDKGVMMAAKGLQGLYRDVGPEMLKKKDRGKDAAMGVRSGERRQRKFGEEDVGTIEGLELFEKWKEEERVRKREERGEPADAEVDDEDEDDDEDEGAWQIDDSASDDSGGWIDVSDEEDPKALFAAARSQTKANHLSISDESEEEVANIESRSEDVEEGGEGEEEEVDDDERQSLYSREGEEPYESTIEIDQDALSTSGAPRKRVKFDPTIALDPVRDKENIADSLSSQFKDANYFATTRILTPADLSKLRELRTNAAISSLMPSTHAKHHQSSSQNEALSRDRDAPVTADAISGLAALSAGRASRAEKLAHLAEMKTPRSDHKSKAARKAERKAEKGKSSTNREKERKKNFLMTLGKAKARGKGGKKGGRSLVQQGKALKAQKGKKAWR
ncbi:MAG: hypothetical protein Q9227_000378 [Pyrenula ochraceoflavens]